MTSHHYQTLLEAYADNELTPTETDNVRNHIESCPECREEYLSLLRLKELLKQTSIRMPSDSYWQETGSLILARTVESPEQSFSEVDNERYRRETEKLTLFRSVVSVFASLAVLFTALYLGSRQDERLAEFNRTDAPVYAIAPFEELVGSEDFVIVSKDERLNQTKGMLLLGAPGTLGKFALLFDWERAVF